MKMKWFSLCLAGAIGVANLCAYAKDDNSMTPPPPVSNKSLDAMVGTWEGTGDMHGMKMHDILKVRWALNHQYVIMELRSRSVDNPKIAYEGIGLFGVNNSGDGKLWWFDNWGADAISTGTGTASNNKLELHDGNPTFKEERIFTINGNTMDMKAKGTMSMNGKETPFDQNVTYHKK